MSPEACGLELLRERDLEAGVAGGLMEEDKVSIQRVSAWRIRVDHNARSNFFQLDHAISGYQDASNFPVRVKRCTTANLEFPHDSSQTRTAGRVVVGH